MLRTVKICTQRSPKSNTKLNPNLKNRETNVNAKTNPNLNLQKTLKKWPYPGIAPSGYSIHYTNTNPSPYPGANPG